MILQSLLMLIKFVNVILKIFNKKDGNINEEQWFTRRARESTQLTTKMEKCYYN